MKSGHENCASILREAGVEAHEPPNEIPNDGPEGNSQPVVADQEVEVVQKVTEQELQERKLLRRKLRREERAVDQANRAFVFAQTSGRWRG
mgnify:CR=1 FL=1